MKTLEKLVEGLILYSRYILVVFYVGLAIALAAYAVSFASHLYDVVVTTLTISETEFLLDMLLLIDKALVASLIVMVMLSSYENFVGRFDADLKEDDAPAWLGRLDPGSLKIKVASTIVAISAIHLLQVFLNMSAFTEQQIFWKTIMHLVFLVSAVFLGILDKITGTKTGKADHS